MRTSPLFPGPSLKANRELVWYAPYTVSGMSYFLYVFTVTCRVQMQIRYQIIVPGTSRMSYTEVDRRISHNAYYSTIQSTIMDIHSHSHRILDIRIFVNMHSHTIRQNAYSQDMHSHSIPEYAYLCNMHSHVISKDAYFRISNYR